MVQRAVNGIKYWGQLLFLPVYWVSFLIPRDRRIWLFGSTFGRRFADNPRYLYLYACTQKEHQGIRPIWISHEKSIVQFLNEHGLEAYYYRSLKGIWFCLRGRIYIFDNYSKDIAFWPSGGAVKFNLWHGTGNKRANHDNIFDKVRHPANLWERFLTFPRRLSDEKPHHYTLATSEPLAVITRSAFASKDMDHVIIDGYPRNDAILNDQFPTLCTPAEQKIVERIQSWKEAGFMIDFYMPTFRDSESGFFEVMDLMAFNTFLQKEKIIFVVKLHPKSRLRGTFANLEYSNIYNIDQDADPYVFFRYVDVLTSDYSSVYSDFMLLDRPVVAFHYDYEKYHYNTRDEYVPFDEYMPEQKARTMQELMEKTVQVLKKDVCRDKRKQSRDRMFLYQDAEASKRLVERIRVLTGLK